MISFAKHIAALAVALIATTALAEKSQDDKASKADAKATPEKKTKKGKSGKAADEASGPKKVDIPVAKGHDSKGMVIPYYNSSGKHEMEFRIGVASRLDDVHIQMTDLKIQTYDEDGNGEMKINLLSAILNTNSSVVTSQQHVTINREDFEMTGETMIFNTRTKQGGLGGNVRMLIYNLGDQDAEENQAGETKPTNKKSKTNNTPDSFRTPHPKETEGPAASSSPPDTFLTSGSK